MLPSLCPFIYTNDDSGFVDEHYAGGATVRSLKDSLAYVYICY